MRIDEDDCEHDCFTIITAYPAGTPIGDLTHGQVMNKQFTRLVVAFHTPTPSSCPPPEGERELGDPEVAG
jgi:hypothetical protein